jgi:hypothetical protein
MGVPRQVYSDIRKAAPWPFPPALFVHMPRDERTAAAVAEDIATLQSQARVAPPHSRLLESPRTWLHEPQPMPAHRPPLLLASHAGASLQGVATKELRHDPLPVTPTFFSDRIEGVSTAVSARLYDALNGGSLLDEKGLLKADPRCVQRCI